MEQLNLTLTESRELLKELNQKRTDLINNVFDDLENLIKYNSGIEVKIRDRDIDVCYEDTDYYRDNKLIGFKYININIVDSESKKAFGADIDFTWFNNGTMYVNVGSCGQFNILGNKDEKSINQIKKYCVLTWLINNTKEVHHLLNSYDYYIIKEYNNIYYYVYKLEEEEREIKRKEEEQQILSMMKIGNIFNFNNNMITISKITPKKVYYIVTTNAGYSYESHMDKKQFITKIKDNDLIIK